MPPATLDERVTALEHEVARLWQQLPPGQHAAGQGWRTTLGMFAGDATMKEIIEEGRKIRELDREQAD